MKLVDRLIDRALSRALARRYQVTGNPPMVYMDATCPITKADAAIMLMILAAEADRSDVGGSGKALSVM